MLHFYIYFYYRPAWISTFHGQMSAQSIKEDLTAYVASVGGQQSFGGLFVAPNTVEEFGRVTAQLISVESSRYMQETMATAIALGNIIGLASPFYLAKLAILDDNKREAERPFNWLPSPPAPDEIISLFI